MDFYEYLVEAFGYQKPIFTEEIAFESYSKPWIFKAMNRLCMEMKAVRFEKGVYYIPKETPFGKARLDPSLVIQKRFLTGSEGACGYVSGATLRYQLGLSSQLPYEIEIYTNREHAKVRSVTVGHAMVLLRRARFEINDANVYGQQLLELMNDLPNGALSEKEKGILRSFVADHGITRKVITECAPYFPDHAMRVLVESEVIYDVA